MRIDAPGQSTTALWFLTDGRLVARGYRRCMTIPGSGAATYGPETLPDLDEPVRRYFARALTPGAPLAPGMRLEMTGRINAGVWMGFRAHWEGDGSSFRWDATCGPLGLRALHVVDAFAEGTGSTDIRLRPGLRLAHSEDADTARSAAGRAAVEAIWAPAALLPERGVHWRAQSDEVIVATRDVPPEHPEIRLRIDAFGSVKAVSVQRWRRTGRGRHEYVACGGDVLQDRCFGDVTIPSWVQIGWWYGSRRYRPFFEATVLAARHVNG